MPVMFSAPASYKCIPVESVFKYLKLTDFRRAPIPASVALKDLSET